MTDEAAREGSTARTPRRIAVVPAYNEETTVEAVLERLHGFVDELVVVDDGSTDATRSIVQGWLANRDGAQLLAFDRNQGMSAAYHLAFSRLRERLASGELDENDLVYTVDADGQHELSSLEELARLMIEGRLDALLVRRDLSGYPIHKRFGNGLLSAWASLWAGGRLHDVESGYRIFRLGALADALHYYRGYKYSETVEVAVILHRLGYRVRNDVVVPVPLYRSRTRMVDAVIDLAVIPRAAWRVRRRRPSQALARKPAG